LKVLLAVINVCLPPLSLHHCCLFLPRSVPNAPLYLFCSCCLYFSGTWRNF